MRKRKGREGKRRGKEEEEIRKRSSEGGEN
jgi:hypothetical protein